MSDTRTVTVKCTWKSTHRIEINVSEPPLASDDLTTILSYEDVTSDIAELTDWEVIDQWPKR